MPALKKHNDNLINKVKIWQKTHEDYVKKTKKDYTELEENYKNKLEEQKNIYEEKLAGREYEIEELNERLGVDNHVSPLTEHDKKSSKEEKAENDLGSEMARAESRLPKIAELEEEIVKLKERHEWEVNELLDKIKKNDEKSKKTAQNIQTKNEEDVEISKSIWRKARKEKKEIKEELTKSQKEINSLRKAESRLQKNNGSLVSEFKREKNSWNKKKSELERKFKELQSELKVVRRDRNSRPDIDKNDYNNLLERLEEVTDQVLSLTEEKENLRQKLDNIPANWQDQINQSQAAQEQAEQNLANLQIELKQVQEAANILNRQIRELKNGLAIEQDVHRETQGKLDSLKNKLEQKNKDIQSLRSNLNREKEQMDKLNKRMANALQETENWKFAYKQAQKEAKRRPALEKHNNLKSQLKTTNETTNLTKKHLRVKSLNNLPTLPQNSDGTSKSLKQLISDFVQMQNQVQAEKLRADTYETDILTEFNITNVNDWKIVLAKLKNRPSHADYDNVRQERNNYKMLIDTHTCPIVNCQEPCCLGDYERLQSKLATQEKEILRKINNFLKLDLASKELTLKKVINRIEELIRNPLTDNQKLWKKLTRAKKTIKLLQKQLIEKDPDYTAIHQAEYQIVLQAVKNDALKNCEKLGINIPSPVKENIEKATTLEMVMRVRNNLIQAKLTKNGEELKMIAQQKGKLIQSQNRERWIQGSFLLISYLVIVWLLVKLNKRERVK